MRSYESWCLGLVVIASRSLLGLDIFGEGFAGLSLPRTMLEVCGGHGCTRQCERIEVDIVDGKVAVRGLIWRGGEHAGGPSCKPRWALFVGPHIMAIPYLGS